MFLVKSFNFVVNVIKASFRIPVSSRPVLRLPELLDVLLFFLFLTGLLEDDEDDEDSVLVESDDLLLLFLRLFDSGLVVLRAWLARTDCSCSLLVS